ncbi:phage holin family protein [Halodesulfovibrio aestuarii]|uniref:Phage holin family protein n=1 Tax=Halodesulfovibrio aestuarii TaxID=126333 RepID=A0ABV4JWW3_9BACT
MQNMVQAYLQGLGTNADIKAIFAALGVCVSAVIGGDISLVNALLALWALDFVLGFKRAWDEHRLSIHKARGGVRKVFMYMLTIIVMGLVEYSMGRYSNIFSPRSLTIAFLCVTEGLSCLEHLSHFGVPIPRKLRERLQTYRDGLHEAPVSQGESK